ncbi:MAG: DUF177 domain-containing protein [Elusimicrobiota bacterium]
MTGCGANLKFSVREIRERGGLEVSLSVLPADLFSEPPSGAMPGGPFAAGLEFSVGGDCILLQACLAGSWTVACGRCLAEHRVAFEAEMDETYALALETIDIREDLRQTALLELPQRSLCRPDCEGLCSQCGKNLNEGPCGCGSPRPAAFEALKKLKE